MAVRGAGDSIRDSVRNAMGIVTDHGFRSIAFPVIGAGSGGYRLEKALDIMLNTFGAISYDGLVRVVEYRRSAAGR